MRHTYSTAEGVSMATHWIPINLPIKNQLFSGPSSEQRAHIDLSGVGVGGGGGGGLEAYARFEWRRSIDIGTKLKQTSCQFGYIFFFSFKAVLFGTPAI